MYTHVVRDSAQSIVDIEMKELEELRGVTVRQVATRFGQAFAVGEDGSLYAWGLKSGDPAQHHYYSCSMGFGSVATQLHPTPIPGFGPGGVAIKLVATGTSHAVFVSTAGQAFSVGRNEAGKLGLGPDADRDALVPERIQFPTTAVPPFLVGAACGAKHTLLLSASGTAWGCGMTQHGALPTTWAASAAASPVPLNALPFFCTGFAAGISMSFFLDEAGQVHFCGTSRWTARPFGFRREPAALARPLMVPGLRNIGQVSVSMELSMLLWEHAVFLRKDGRAFAWGHFGHGEFSPERQPQGDVDGFCNEATPILHWPPKG